MHPLQALEAAMKSSLARGADDSGFFSVADTLVKQMSFHPVNYTELKSSGMKALVVYCPSIAHVISHNFG